MTCENGGKESDWLKEQKLTNVMAAGFTLMNFATTLPRLYEIGLQIKNSDIPEMWREPLREYWEKRRQELSQKTHVNNAPTAPKWRP